MLHIAQFGAGRIGAIHAANIAQTQGAKLKYVVDVNAAAAAALAETYGASVTSPASAMADPEVGAVIIASSTDTHADLTIAAAQAGKAIFCEKPIDLSLDRVDACLSAVHAAGVPMFVGFNRRFDRSFQAVHDRIAAGDIGDVEQVVISSRDPSLPPIEYLRVSGGLFRDMTIHDFDMGRWLLGEEPEQIFATGSSLVDPAVAEAGDIDSAMVIMRTASGKLCHINNSRRATYGYDQRIEVHGSKGRLLADNVRPTSMELADGNAVTTEKPFYFFLERYAQAYASEMKTFIDCLTQDQPIPVTAQDGRQALVLAEAAYRSMQEKRSVAISEITGGR